MGIAFSKCLKNGQVEDLKLDFLQHPSKCAKGEAKFSKAQWAILTSFGSKQKSKGDGHLILSPAWRGNFFVFEGILMPLGDKIDLHECLKFLKKKNPVHCA